MTNPEQAQKIPTEEIRTPQEVIADFARRHRLSQQKYTYPKFEAKVLVLQPSAAQPVKPVELESVMQVFPSIKVQQLQADCWGTVKEIYAQNPEVRLLRTLDSSDELVGGMHSIVQMKLENASVVACDLTAGLQVDLNQGNFDALVLAAADQDELISLLNDLYGGDWSAY